MNIIYNDIFNIKHNVYKSFLLFMNQRIIVIFQLFNNKMERKLGSKLANFLNINVRLKL